MEYAAGQTGQNFVTKKNLIFNNTGKLTAGTLK